MDTAEGTGTLRKSLRTGMLSYKSKTINTTDLQQNNVQVHSCLLRARTPIGRCTSIPFQFEVGEQLEGLWSKEFPVVQR